MVFAILRLQSEENFIAFGDDFSLLTKAVVEALLVPDLDHDLALLSPQHGIVEPVLPLTFEVDLCLCRRRHRFDGE